MNPRIITEKEIQEVVAFDEASIKAVEEAFRILASETPVMMPPVMQININDVSGQACVKAAYVAGSAYFVIKLASTFHQNHRLGIPSASGLMLICNALSGYTECILLDNGYLTALRTQAAGAIAARYLSVPESRSAGIIGAGRQARLQLEALRAVRPIERAFVWSPVYSECVGFAQEMSEKTGIDISPMASAEEAVRGVDIVVTATPAKTPIVRREWLSAGQHLTAMGADAPGKSELFPDVIPAATIYVCDSDRQCRTLSELHASIHAGSVPPDFPTVEIGEVIAGNHPGRQNAGDISIADLTGLGIQDAAIAVLAWSRIKEEPGRDG